MKIKRIFYFDSDPKKIYINSETLFLNALCFLFFFFCNQVINVSLSTSSAVGVAMTPLETSVWILNLGRVRVRLTPDLDITAKKITEIFSVMPTTDILQLFQNSTCQVC